MRHVLAVVLCLAVLLTWSQIQGIFVSAQAGPQQPALDKRFCADSNGDGVLNIADAVTVLDYLFTGNATPYCVAQDSSAPFATKDETEALRAELAALRRELKAVPRYYSGVFQGDGAAERLIETGISGKIQALWFKFGDAGGYIETASAWTSSDAPPEVRVGLGAKLSLQGANFSVFYSAGEPSYNNPAYTTYWIALVAPE